MEFPIPSADRGDDSQSRLNDYLNDKIQTFADFETLDALLANARTQHKLLRTQLDSVERDLSTTDRDSAIQDATVQREISFYERQSEDIDRRLQILTQSDTSDDAVQKFNASMEKLERMEIASGYLELLSDIDRLSEECTFSLDTEPQDALQPYLHLRHLLIKLKSLQEKAEGAAPHLVDHVQLRVGELRQTIKEAFAAQLRALLDKILWPRPDVVIPSGVQLQWKVVCANLLTLQEPELSLGNSEGAVHVAERDPEVLYPLEVIVHPLEKRFTFHFNGDRPTNRLNKPEYFLSHTLDVLNTYLPFIQEYIQPVLNDFARSAEISFHPAYIDASSAFITALLPMLRSKILSLVPQILDQPSLLSHFIHELMGFDNTLREEWRYTGNSLYQTSPWRGLTWEVLAREDWFARWLQVEKDFALARYDSIVNDPESNSLDYDSLGEDTTKATKAAIRVHDLLETITERYRPLSSFSQKLRFLIDVQISIFDRFHGRLSSGLDAFLSMTSSIGRTVKGASESDLASVQGVNGIDRLCRIFGSADYLEAAMRDWSDEVFFLDLWDELQYRAKARSTNSRSDPSQPQDHLLVAGPLSIAEVASRTSNRLNESTNEAGIGDESVAGALFDETASAYARLRDRSERVIVDNMNSGLRESLRTYAPSSLYSSPVPTASAPANGNDNPLSPSASLNPVLQYLSSSLGFLVRTLARLPLLRITRQVMRTLDSFIFDRIIKANSLSAETGKQIAMDIGSLVALIDKVIGGSVGQKGLRKCLEARILLLLEDEVSRDEKQDGTAWDDEDDKYDNIVRPSMKEVEKLLFESNESARTVLDALALETLTETDAREVLRRVVEPDK